MRIFAIGETTYDILFRDGNPVGACSGGSAYNSAISLGRCGLPVSLISTFGNDPVGDLSMTFLTENGVNCNLIKRFAGKSRIALAFFDSENKADYFFYQASHEIIPDYPVPQKDDLILLGSSFAIRDCGREKLLEFLHQAKAAGCIIIYDPNTRQSLADQPEIINKILQNIALATIIKGSDQDFLNIFGLKDGKSVYSHISASGSQVLIYTKGDQGAELFTNDLYLVKPARETKVVSTIGAGDNFSAGIVYGIFKHMVGNRLFKELTPNNWEEVINFGIFFATEVCGSPGNYLPSDASKRILSGQI
jgi:fructokinase